MDTTSEEKYPALNGLHEDERTFIAYGLQFPGTDRVIWWNDDTAKNLMPGYPETHPNRPRLLSRMVTYYAPEVVEVR